LQNEIRTQQSKENKQKDDVDEREHNQPAEVVFLGPAQFHAETGDVDLTDRALLRADWSPFPMTAGS
jgi:hypothetical protein